MTYTMLSISGLCGANIEK